MFDFQSELELPFYPHLFPVFSCGPTSHIHFLHFVSIPFFTLTFILLCGKTNSVWFQIWAGAPFLPKFVPCLLPVAQHHTFSFCILCLFYFFTLLILSFSLSLSYFYLTRPIQWVFDSQSELPFYPHLFPLWPNITLSLSTALLSFSLFHTFTFCKFVIYTFIFLFDQTNCVIVWFPIWCSHFHPQTFTFCIFVCSLSKFNFMKQKKQVFVSQYKADFLPTFVPAGIRKPQERKSQPQAFHFALFVYIHVARHTCGYTVCQSSEGSGIRLLPKRDKD